MYYFLDNEFDLGSRLLMLDNPENTFVGVGPLRDNYFGPGRYVDLRVPTAMLTANSEELIERYLGFVFDWSPVDRSAPHHPEELWPILYLSAETFGCCLIGVRLRDGGHI